MTREKYFKDQIKPRDITLLQHGEEILKCADKKDSETIDSNDSFWIITENIKVTALEHYENV